MKLIIKNKNLASELLVRYIKEENIPYIDIMDEKGEFFYVVNSLTNFTKSPCLVLPDETCITDIPTIKMELDKHAANCQQ